ncbi:hypothetical protein ACFYYH_27340 [Streptomyces sp. NPDC002018]|uniref:hypothetical protein n=1 Tax=Streptomyces sp. NPDC002018 TaxID=3364629 RepID=UPI0036B32C7C
MPYQEDLGTAFEELRRKVFEERDYYWDQEDGPRPGTLEELWEDESVQESGTHSILDIFRIAGPGEYPEDGVLIPVPEDEALRVLGTSKPTRSDVPAFEAFGFERWQGRCVVLHDGRGEPREIYFWGASGD